MVRLKDIAMVAGVSVMTVSKALRDEPDISAATKARLRKLAEEMGYTPDSNAQSLRNRATRLLGLVISAVTNPLFARLMLGLEEQAHRGGYDLLLAQSLNDPEREEAVVRRLLSRRIDGLFLAPVYRLAPTAPIYEELQRRRLPVVLLGQRAPFCSGFVNVETDDSAGAYLATRHLLELGHRRIACFLGPPAPPTQERLEGYRRALREAQLEPDDHLLFKAGSTIEEGRAAAEQLQAEAPQATAVTAFNDMVAIGAASHLLDRGVRIPEDLSVVGYGNILAAEHFRVPLTTIRQPKMRLGLAAMEAMRKLLRGEPVESTRLGVELAVRRSTGPPPHAPLR